MWDGSETSTGHPGAGFIRIYDDPAGGSDDAWSKFATKIFIAQYAAGPTYDSTGSNNWYPNGDNIKPWIDSWKLYGSTNNLGIIEINKIGDRSVYLRGTVKDVTYNSKAPATGWNHGGWYTIDITYLNHGGSDATDVNSRDPYDVVFFPSGTNVALRASDVNMRSSWLCDNTYTFRQPPKGTSNYNPQTPLQLVLMADEHDDSVADASSAGPHLILSQDAGKITGALYLAGGSPTAPNTINADGGDSPHYNALVLASSDRGISFCCNDDFGGGTGEISGPGVFGNEWAEGNQKMCIKPDGKIGMGITTPEEILDVGGNVKATGFCVRGKYNLPVDDGTYPNQVLKTDAAGATAWASPGYDFVIACSDETSALTVDATAVTFYSPRTFYILGGGVSLKTASSSGNVQVEVLNDKGSPLVAPISLSAGEKIKQGPIVGRADGVEVPFGTQITISITAAGSGAIGLKYLLYGVI